LTAVRGNLGTVGVPRLFRAIADERRTGRLVLIYPAGGQESHVFFRRGDAYHARLLGNRIQLGTRLVSAGYLSHEDVDRALEVQKSEGSRRRLGEILIEEGMVPRGAIEEIVKEQIEDTIFEILRWDDGIFEFEQDVMSDEDIGLQVSVENLVMEGARRFREWHQITRRIPTLEAIPRFADDSGGAIEVALTPEEWSLVSKVDGHATVSELAVMCGFTELEAARCVFGLVTAGLLAIQLPEGVELPQEDRELDAVFDELEQALEEASRDRTTEGHAPVSLEEIAAESTEEISLPEVAEEPEPFVVEPEPFVVEPEPFVVEEVAAVEEIPEEGLLIEEELANFEDLPVIDEADRSPAQPSGPGPAFYPVEEELQPEEEPFYEHHDEIPTGHTLPESEVEPALSETESLITDEPITREAITTEYAEAVPAALAPQTQVVAEEIVPDGYDAASLSHVFADLSHSPNGEETTAMPAPEAPSESPPEVEPEEVRPDPSAPPPPIDPNVDTNALIREFSALGTDEGPDQGGVIEMPSRGRKIDKTDKSKGLFGRRKR
jgi:hypothetical protein